MERNWIVLAGQPVNTSQGGGSSGGYEFFGPYTEAEAKDVQKRMYGRETPRSAAAVHGDWISMAIQLLRLPNDRAE